MLFLSVPVCGLEDLPLARSLVSRAATIASGAGPPMIESAASYFLGWIECQSGNLTAAEEQLKRAIVVARNVGNPNHESLAMNYLAALYEDKNDYVLAHAYWVSCATIHQRLGTNIGLYSTRAAACARALGRLAAARTLWAEVLTLSPDSGDGEDPVGTVHACLALADVDLLEGQLGPARTYLHDATSLATRVRSESAVGACIDACGRMMYAHGQSEYGVRLLGAGSLHRGGENRDPPLDVYNIVGASADTVEDEARELFGDERFTALHNEGRAMSLDEALTEFREYLGIPESAASESKTSEEVNE
ncbi:MAG TPA: tetratricopeptide repeat protein [Planctomycetes bacterium]|nr:tetratricopeptide repeat protein [Planctomycetota bacterium]